MSGRLAGKNAGQAVRPVWTASTKLPRVTALPPAEAARLDTYARTMRTGMVALFLVAAMVNLIPRTPGEFPAETVSEVRR